MSTEENNATPMLDAVRAHLVAGHRIEAENLIYDTIDTLMSVGRFDDVAAHLRAFTAAIDLPLATLRSALAISSPVKEAMGAARSDLVARVRAMAMEEGGQAKVDRYLRGLE